MVGYFHASVVKNAFQPDLDALTYNDSAYKYVAAKRNVLLTSEVLPQQT